jgi:RNA polymerase sigma factor (sigma-70 family)
LEASAIPASVGLKRTRIALSAPLLRIRSDEQLVSLFRAGNEEAFRAIHDRYRQRLFAYTRQMLGGSAQDAEDAVQEIFVRAYGGLRANTRELALRAWLYRIAHNRCIDELRRPYPAATEVIGALAPVGQDPVSRVEQRDTLRRLIADVQRLPEQQRSALLMRELGGMPYADVSGALSVSVPAVKSLLVRARIGLAQASDARDTACAQIREDMILAHDRGVRTSGLARRHMRDCAGCREFRSEVRGVSRQFAALVPGLGPIGVIAKLLGVGGAGGSGAAAGSGTVAGGGAAVTGGVAGTGAAASVGAIATGAGHVVTLLAAAVVTAGGAIELQRTIAAPVAHHPTHHRIVHNASPARTPAYSAYAGSPSAATLVAVAPSQTSSSAAPAAATMPAAVSSPVPRATRRRSATAKRSRSSAPVPISETLDPDDMSYGTSTPTSSAAASTATGSSTTTGSATGTTSGTPTSTDPASTTTPATATPGTGSATSSTGTVAGGSTGSTTTGSSTGATTPASGQAGSSGSTTTPSSTVSGDTSISSGAGGAAPRTETGAVFTPN